MAMSQVIELSKDGKLTIPPGIFKELGMAPLNKLLMIGEKDCIILKKIQTPLAKERFQTVADKVANRFKEKGITRKDVEEAISWARKPK